MPSAAVAGLTMIGNSSEPMRSQLSKSAKNVAGVRTDALLSLSLVRRTSVQSMTAVADREDGWAAQTGFVAHTVKDSCHGVPILDSHMEAYVCGRRVTPVATSTALRASLQLCNFCKFAVKPFCVPIPLEPQHPLQRYPLSCGLACWCRAPRARDIRGVHQQYHYVRIGGLRFLAIWIIVETKRIHIQMRRKSVYL